MKIYKKTWEKSYLRNENLLLYPDENLIRFVNKFVYKRTKYHAKKMKHSFLDIGCGAGRNVAYLVENGFHTTGIDISKNAIDKAKKLLKYKKLSDKKYILKNTSSANYFSKESSFDVIVSCASLDSMPSNEIDLTIENINVLLKKKGFLYVDLMSFSQKRKGKFINNYDQIVDENHERGTIQSYWDLKRIKKKFQNLKTIEIKRITSRQGKKITNERFYCIFKKIA